MIDLESLISALSGEGAKSLLGPHYGVHPDLIKERAEKLIGLAAAFREYFPSERRAVLFRIPGRINLMGVHIDHRGGWCNYMPIARETFFCASPRNDDRICCRNVSPQHPPIDFSLTADFPFDRRGSWMEFIEGASIERGHWGNYIKAGAFKMQDMTPDLPLTGMNLVMDGDIPPRSGLSSSSTLVVGSVLALSYVNELFYPDYEQVELCGEAEWYVGTRGGCGDHAAMILGDLNRIVHVGFMPLSASYCSLPENVEVVLAQSGVQADKAVRARETFNARIAAYEAAFEIYRDAHPAYRDRLEHIRDISPANLEASPGDFYQTLKAVPVRASQEDLQRTHPHLRGAWERIFTTYGAPGEPLPLREVLLFGVSECARARRFMERMKENDLAGAGRLMFTSHDGDRVAVWEGGRSRPYQSRYDDRYLDELTERVRESPEDEAVKIAWQPGGYRCSVPEMDRLVDRCKKLEGVYGAGLTGAGLGGAILALTHPDASAHVVDELTELIAEWCDAPFVERCRPAGGAALLELS
ncbi:MAG: hypothetical protein JXR73_21370 [Candidatus Omnitrophica bacterium]|nr:hypothetical protein [Candidatus Omnitrophota bacterium]